MFSGHTSADFVWNVVGPTRADQTANLGDVRSIKNLALSYQLQTHRRARLKLAVAPNSETPRASRDGTPRTPLPVVPGCTSDFVGSVRTLDTCTTHRGTRH